MLLRLGALTSAGHLMSWILSIMLLILKTSPFTDFCGNAFSGGGLFPQILMFHHEFIIFS